MRRLDELEQLGLDLKNSGQSLEAIKLFEQIIIENPSYEWGICYCLIAECWEDLGEYGKANKYYLKSIEYDNEDEIRLGNYASFLYLHGDPKEAFKWYLRTYHLKRSRSMDVKRTVLGINNLAKKIGLSDEQVQKLIDDKDAANMFIKNA